MNIDFPHSTLIIVDVQNDFCAGGALEVKDAEQVIDPLNRLASLFLARSGRVAATQDWHPAKHASFASSHEGKKPGDTVDLLMVKNQVLWPDHCIQGSAGAEFHASLDTKPLSFIIRKGFRGFLDSYSAFFENDRKTPTGLDGFLKALSIDTVVLGGLATDYCVLYSALDALALGYKTIILKDAVRGVDIPAGSAEKAIMDLLKAGAAMADSSELQ